MNTCRLYFLLHVASNVLTHANILPLKLLMERPQQPLYISPLQNLVTTSRIMEIMGRNIWPGIHAVKDNHHHPPHHVVLNMAM